MASRPKAKARPAARARAASRRRSWIPAPSRGATLRVVRFQDRDWYFVEAPRLGGQVAADSLVIAFLAGESMRALARGMGAPLDVIEDVIRIAARGCEWWPPHNARRRGKAKR